MSEKDRSTEDKAPENQDSNQQDPRLLQPPPEDGRRAPSITNSKNGRRSTSPANSAEAKLQMPSMQANAFTRAHNKLRELKDKQGVEGVVRDAIKDAETQLGLLKEELDAIAPDNDLQKRFKESWIAKNVAKKEQFVIEAKRAFLQFQLEREQELRSSSSRRSRASSTRRIEMERAAAEAAAEEAVLQKQQEQLASIQAARRKAQENELLLQEQEEQDEIIRRLEMARVRRERLDDAVEAASSKDSSIAFPIRVPRLPTLQQPTTAWINDSKTAAASQKMAASKEDLPPPITEAPEKNLLLQHVLLSQAHVPMFKGDPLDFMWFWRAFEAQVEAVTDDASKKLYMLLQKLEGEPRTLIKGCQLATNATEGYRRAVQLLRERYGHPVQQAMAFRNKLFNWPHVKNAQELAAYSVQLQLCKEVKMGTHQLNELDDALTVLQLASKLPSKLQTAWQNKVVDIEIQQSRESNFDDFLAFVKKQERARNHPVFGKLTSDKRELADSKVQTLSTITAESTLATTSNKPPLTGTVNQGNMDKEETQRPGILQDQTSTKPLLNAFKAPCLLCAGEHPTSKCANETNLPREERKAKLNGLCFSCLKPGHSARFCKFRLKCDKCHGMHPTCLHEDRVSTNMNNVDTESHTLPEASDAPAPEQQSSSATSTTAPRCLVSTVLVKIWVESQNKALITRAILDSASTATFINASLAAKLGATRKPTILKLSTMTHQGGEVPTDAVFGLKVSDLSGNSSLDIGLAYTVETVPTQGSAAPAPYQLRSWPHLADLELDHEEAPAVAELLIGQNVPKAAEPLEVRHSEGYGPYAVRSALGWALHGPLTATAEPIAVANRLQVETPDIDLNRLLYQDFAGAFDFATKGPSQEDAHWLAEANRTVKRVASSDAYQYSIELPFRAGALSQLRDNRQQALQRLRGLARKFDASPQFKCDYVAFMDKMTKSGFVEEVPGSNPTEATTAGINYVVHHGVYHPRKNKIRVVYNCASKFRGLSLNDCLISGPDLTNSIVGVLLRFRQFCVAFTADIDSMFYQVLVPEHQRDLLRFLWWPEGQVGEEHVKTYRLKVHLFGATSSPSIANFALRKAADDALSAGEVSHETMQAVKRNFYVDDCLKSECSENEAIMAAHDLVRACSYGGFRLSKFVSTSINLLRTFSKDELAKDLNNVDFSDDKLDPLAALQERALGVAWDVKRDRFSFRISAESSSGNNATKRQMLSTLSKVYDPLGFAAPVVVQARLLFRELTKEELSWDEQVDDRRREQWLGWVKSLENLQAVNVPRWMGPTSKNEPWELHAFCDASTQAYAVSVYLRRASAGSDSMHDLAFVIGKARVAPPKVVTIPRLELVAATLATEMVQTTQKELDLRIEARWFWSDSQVVLKYLHNTKKRFHTFVANRVQTILAITNLSEWRYVPTNVNPADEATRGLPAERLATSMWLRGPDFLRTTEENWPPDLEDKSLTGTDSEVKVSLATTAAHRAVLSPNDIAAQFSSFYCFKKCIAKLMRLRERLKNKTFVTQGPFSTHELETAWRAVVQWLQRERWPDEVESLSTNKPIPRSSELYKLAPAVVGGLLVACSRTDRRLPILPPGQVSDLLIRHLHATNGHAGRQTTMAAALRDWWIMKLSGATRRVIKCCARCQRNHSPPMSVRMADLPDFRVQPRPPFEVTGVDYFGPFHVRNLNSRAKRKAYGVLFTCAVSRAVHLELAESLQTASFIQALRRFVARRGTVKKFVSDNGSNLTGANMVLQRELQQVISQNVNSDEVRNALLKQNIDWYFIPPGGSHHGGFYERLIRSVRRILDGLIAPHDRNSALTTEALSTFLCEVEAILNNRPLTTVTEDLHDLEPLTPNHLLLGRAGAPAPPGNFESASEALRHRWKQVQHLAHLFWSRWTKEYVPLLYLRSKWHRSRQRVLQVNDIVLVTDQLKRRNQWKLGRVVAVQQGQDGLVRSADIRTTTGIFTRPVTKLCLLETTNLDRWSTGGSVKD